MGFEPIRPYRNPINYHLYIRLLLGLVPTAIASTNSAISALFKELSFKICRAKNNPACLFYHQTKTHEKLFKNKP